MSKSCSVNVVKYVGAEISGLGYGRCADAYLHDITASVFTKLYAYGIIGARDQAGRATLFYCAVQAAIVDRSIGRGESAESCGSNPEITGIIAGGKKCVGFCGGGQEITQPLDAEQFTCGLIGDGTGIYTCGSLRGCGKPVDIVGKITRVLAIIKTVAIGQGSQKHAAANRATGQGQGH
jgi:hypothetical protein